MSCKNITHFWAILRKMRLHDYTSVYITGDIEQTWGKIKQF